DQAVRELRQKSEVNLRELDLSSEKDLEAEYRTAAKALYRKVFAPLRQALGKASLIYLAPDGELNHIAFEALVDDKDRYLIEDYRFAYLSSGRDLLRPPPKLARGTVVFAGPDFNLKAPQRQAQAKALAVEAPKETALALRGAPEAEVRGLRWKPLPGAAAEAA